MTELLAQIEADPAGPAVETLNYGVSCKGVDFGMLTARNQLISKVINPLLDQILVPLKQDHVIDSETKYVVNVVVTATRDIDTVQ